MAEKDMFLYWGSGSAPCWKPMIVLEEKQLSGYGQKLISFSAKEHKSEEIMKLNPRGQVRLIYESKISVVSSSIFLNYPFGIRLQIF